MPIVKAVKNFHLGDPFTIKELGIKVIVRRHHRGEFTMFAETIAAPAAECRPVLAKIEPERKLA